jgi:hemerythrin-like domain-containing protein
METRRRFLSEAAGLASIGWLTREAQARPKEKDEEEVSPTEDLMREHGVLRRILLVYGEIVRRVSANEEVKAEPVARAAEIVRAFVEDYHERDEEEFIFPRVKKVPQMADLVDVLVQQHQAGRKLTASIARLATAPNSRKELAEAMQKFVRMYEPHASREDTVLFPAFVRVVGKKERHALQETFERKEKGLPLGDFEKMVEEVGAIERALGIYQLAQFTPR